MPKYYWEDFQPGAVAIYGPRLVTREEIVAFAAEFDPQPMHLDEAAAAATLLGGLGASGWHTCCLLMRMIADGFVLDSSSMGAPGVDEVRWLAPLRPGTSIRIRDTVVDTRASGSRPHMGLVKHFFEVLDDADSHHDADGELHARPSRSGRCGMKYFEDIRVGDAYEVGRYTFTADDIKSFAQRFDPQLFHLDEDAAAQSHFGALCASGWHTAVVWMRLMVDHRRALIEVARARGEPVAAIGPALGFRDLKWLKPVYAGDTIDYKSEVIETRVSSSRPGSGLMTIRSTGVNQNGEMVISFVSTTFVECRPEMT